MNIVVSENGNKAIITKSYLSKCIWSCAGTVCALIQPCLWVKTVDCLLKHSSALMSTKSPRTNLLSELEVDHVRCGRHDFSVVSLYLTYLQSFDSSLNWS